MLGALVALGQLAGAIGFYWYFNQAISNSMGLAPGTFSPDAVSATWSATWAKVYLCSVLAAVVLTAFAAKGTKMWCALGLLVVFPLAPWIPLLVLPW
jgi:hypothetical protein